MPQIRSPEGQPTASYPPDVFAAAAWSRGRDPIVTLLAEHGPDQSPRWTGWAILPDTLSPADRASILAAATVDAVHAIGMPVHVVRCNPASRPAVAFLDRDGTIIEDRHYLADPQGVALLPAAAGALRAMASTGMRLVVISNQSGVGRGRISPEQLDAVTGQFDTSLKAAGVILDGIYICPHIETDRCNCRKPAPGLAHRAAAELGLDLARAVMVGDKPADLGLATRLGIPSFLVLTGDGATTLGSQEAKPDYVVDDLAGVARICASPTGLIVPSSLPGLP
jgi:D-glycero-D-manno-heptose 1,7-bisphosphate phosphatase